MVKRKMSVLILGLVCLTEGQLAGYSAKTDPSLKLTPTRPIVKNPEDKDALITCIVQNQGDFTLMWKKTSKIPNRDATVLSANTHMVTSDKRMKVMHATGGQVYVLKITNVTMFDAGIYFCEVNTDPPIMALRELTVLRRQYRKVKKLPLPSSDINSSHNFTSCCVSKNVSTSCQQFCHLDFVMDGVGLGKPEDCEDEFPSIVSCMADGRNHMPCCVDAGIPEMCTGLCKGEFNIKTGSIKVISACRDYVEPTLSCIATGIGK